MQGLDQIFNLDPLSLGIIVIRTVIVYVVLLIGIRLAGKRQLGQMTTFDLVVLLIISNAVQNAMVGPDSSLTGGIVAAVALLLANRLIGRLALRFPRLARELTGNPSLLIHEGEWIEDHLRAEGVTKDEVLQAMREHGVDRVESIKDAVLEVDGTISIVPIGAASSRTRRRVRGRKPAG